MKKIRLMIIAMVMMTAVSAQAQQYNYEKKNEVAITYGWMSNSDWIDAFEDIGGALIGVSFDNDSYTGPLSVEYFHRVKPGISLGGIFAYGKLSQDVFLNGKKNGKDGTAKNTYFTVMPSVKMDWMRKKNVAVYTKLAAGVTLRSEKINYDDTEYTDHSDSKLHFNWRSSV